MLNKVAQKFKIIFVFCACSSVNAGDDHVSNSGCVSTTIVENILPNYFYIFCSLYHLQEGQLSL